MKITVIISYYKALDNLKLILAGLQRQSDQRFEVIISEDDHNFKTSEFLATEQSNYRFPINHLHQDADEGFRKNMMLNKSIRKANTDFIVFIDGDCIPERHFVKQYIRNAAAGHIFWGRRVMMGESISANILKTQSLRRLNFLSALFSDSYKTKEAIYFPLNPLSLSTRGLKGCNWGVMKNHLLAVNGFDEDYVKAGVGEDNDIEWRLLAFGLSKVSMKNKAIVYHLYHPRGYSDQGVRDNFAVFQIKQKKGHLRCINGLEKIQEHLYHPPTKVNLQIP